MATDDRSGNPSAMFRADPHLLDTQPSTGSVIWSLFYSLCVIPGPMAPIFCLPRLASSWGATDELNMALPSAPDVKFHQYGSPLPRRDVSSFRSHEPATVQRTCT